MKTTAFAAAAMIALPALGEIQHAYLQDLDTSVSTYASSDEPYSNGGGFRGADNFTLAAETSIAGATWWGQSAGFVHPDLTNFTAFVVRIYAGEMLPEGNPVFSQTFTVGETNAADTGLRGSNDAIIYRHDVAFDAPVTLAGGTQYWFSVSVIHDELPFPGERWNWSGSSLLDGSAGFGFFNGVWQTNPTDRAFGLVVPGPGAGAAFAAGALFAARRRRA